MKSRLYCYGQAAKNKELNKVPETGLTHKEGKASCQSVHISQRNVLLKKNTVFSKEWLAKLDKKF